MAFAFFRRHQKGIMIIMVLLMFSFLVGYQGLSYIMSWTRGGGSGGGLGESKLYGTVSSKNWHQSRVEMDSLLRYTGLGAGRTDADGRPLPPASREFATIQARCGDDAVMMYELLKREAAKNSPAVSTQEVMTYLKSIGISDARWASIRNTLLSSDKAPTESQLLAMLTNWKRVLDYYNKSKAVTPVSPETLKIHFRDLNEKINLRIVKLPIQDYVDAKAVVSDKQIKDQFEKYKAIAPVENPDRLTEENPMGFGYKVPAKVQVAYLMVDIDAVTRGTVVVPADARTYWREHKAEFTREVPIKPVAGDKAATTQADTKPKTKTVEKTIDEAWQEVLAQKKPLVVKQILGVYVQKIQIAVGKTAAEDISGDRTVYETVVSMMTQSADEALAVVIDKKVIAAIRNQPLDKAMEKLAKAAELQAIVYPWDTNGRFKVKKDVAVPAALKADKDMPLGVVLDKITKLVFGEIKADKAAAGKPAIKWAMCEGIDGVVFPVGGSLEMNLFPLKTGKTELLDGKTLLATPIVGTAVARRGSLAASAFTSKPFGLDSKYSSGMEIGKPGQMMQVMESRQSRNAIGLLLWNLVKVELSHAAGEITPGIKDRIVRDVRLQNALNGAAKKAAEELLALAKTKGLLTAAKTMKLKAETSELFTRKSEVDPRMYLYQMVMSRQVDMATAMEQIFLVPQMDVLPSQIKGVQGPSMAVSKLRDKAFEMVPADINKPVDTSKPGPVAVVPAASARAIYVIERIGYLPAVAAEFTQEWRTKRIALFADRLEWKARELHFNPTSITKRTEFTKRER